jgi:NAD(P)-dependent dehydrogenase (short-subunit alcohol dehydrogenase family)
MVRCLADEMVVDNIRVNGVAPGLIRSAASTPLWSDPQLLEESVRDIPLGRIGEPEDIAGAVIFLSSAAGSFVTGSTILVDGGRVLLTPPVARAS